MAKHFYFWRPTLAAALVALLGVPVAFTFNKAVKSVHPAGILALAVAVLGAIVVLLRKMAPYQPKIFYAFSLFAFTSVVDLLIPLEMDGWVEGFMDVYLVNGEPYLLSSWGAMSAYWDGTFNLCCYLYMAFCVSNRVSYRYTAILYASNILNSMVVLLLGAFLSGVGLHWCTFLNVPYVLVPAYVLWTALEEPAPKGFGLPERCFPRKVALHLLVLANGFNVMRGVAALGSPVQAMALYRNLVEPLMNQKIPAPFAAVQFITCDFYLSLAFLVIAIALVRNPHNLWILDLAVGATGVALQAEVCLVGMQWHPLTDSLHHQPPDAGGIARALHVCVHVVTLLAPGLCATALYVPRHFVAFKPGVKARLDSTNTKSIANKSSKPKGNKDSQTNGDKSSKSSSKTTNGTSVSKATSSKNSTSSNTKVSKVSASKSATNGDKTSKTKSASSQEQRKKPTKTD